MTPTTSPRIPYTSSPLTTPLRAVILQDAFGAFPEDLRQEAVEAGIDLSYRPVNESEDVLSVAADAEVLWQIGGGYLLNAELLDALPCCRAIIRSGSGVDNIPVAAATERGIAVFNTPAATALPVAETTVSLILAVYRNLAALDRDTREGGWGQFNQTFWPPAPLYGKTLGLVGFGEIARWTARLVSGFGFKLKVADPFVSAETLAEYGASRAELSELLENADIVSLHCPLTEKTRHLIGREELRRMKPEAILINTARGGVVEEAALAEALREGWIAGAGLDVFEQEPPAPDSPLLRLPNLSMTPHLAAHTRRIADDMRRCGLDVLLTLARGEHPASCVNPGVLH